LLLLIGNFILTVTRVIPEIEQNKTINKKINIKRKSVVPNKILSMYAFNNFDEFCDFCTYLDNSYLNGFTKKLKKSSLYLYNGKYYLLLNNVTLSLKDFKSFHCAITEFATYIIDSDIFGRKLSEYGKVIIGSNAIGTCIKHFS